MPDAPTATRRFDIGFALWLAAAVLAGGAATARVFTTDRAWPNLVRGWVLTAVCALCAVLAWRLLRRPARATGRTVLGWVLAYHALLAPIAMAELAVHLASRNDQLANRLFPHVVAFVNRFE